MSIDENRAFNYAVLASLALHAALLLVVDQPERPNPAQPQVPIIARLVEPPEPAATVSPPTAAPQAERIKPRPRAKPPPKPAVKAAPAPQPVLTEANEPPLQQAQPEPQPAAVTPPSAVAEQPPSAAAAERQSEAPPPVHTLGQYRLEIMSAARKSLRYPPLARENNWEGRVDLRIIFGPTGRVASLRVTKTSGYDVLDKQAVEMYRKAAAAVPVPPDLRGKAFEIEVAAAYELRD